MKSRIVLLVIMAVALCGTASAQSAGGNGGNRGNMQTKRVYHVFANSETNPDSVMARNELLAQSGAPHRGVLAGLGAAIVAGYSNKLIQGAVNVTTQAIGLAVKTISAWINKNKNDRESWLKAAERQNHFRQSLQTQVYIDDFYYGTSTSGALDPMNMKFNGFGCLCYMRPDQSAAQGQQTESSGQNPGEPTAELPVDFRTDGQETPEIWEFFLTCKLREDSLGRAHIVNHSKFYVEVDQLIFDTRHTSLPNDSLPGRAQRRFDFNKRKDLTFTVNVKVFSSWINQAIMLTDNQQIGEFNITAHIDSSDLNADGVFVYDPALNGDKVTVTGESFIVPRSYTGTADAPSWGSGQYRLEMTVYEDCAMNLPYYQKPPRKSGGKSADLAAANPQGQSKNKPKPRWDNKKWQPEWKEMQAGRKTQSAFNTAWQSVTTAYVNKDWVQELVSPLTTAVSSQEKLALSKLLNVDGGGTQTGSGQGGQTGGQGGSTGGQSGGGNPTSAPPGNGK